ncbi:hypothetical protein [Paenibacillus piri]|uniref:Uncharacterized protein n=1 Tax=Paenibacillus piri TaxID=2547395 RepID=A0A4R5KL31_9BACL|nr:hypothetical protein [Paenibacillus piri]TDF95150.1 hypothetical protein E1757_21715 [Paenibacillus piri]
MHTKVDFNFLESKYHILTKDLPGSVLSASLSDLQDKEKAMQLIRSVMRIIRAGQPDIAAFHLSSWLGMVCSAVQASLSLYDTVLLLSPERIRLHIMMVDGRRNVSFLVEDIEHICISIERARVSRAEALNRFYERTVFPILRGMALAAGTRESQLWAQFVTRMYNESDYMSNHASFKDREHWIKWDFALLLNELRLEKLELRRNPFDVKFNWIGQLHNPDELTRKKTACCLAYMTGTAHGYCYTCPRLDEAGRRERRLSAN